MFILLRLLNILLIVLFEQISRTFGFFFNNITATETAAHAELAQILPAAKAGLLLGTAPLLHDPRHVHGHELLNLWRLDCLSPARRLRRIYGRLHLPLDRYASWSLDALSHGRGCLSGHGLRVRY